jgi:hypothetical protein
MADFGLRGSRRKTLLVLGAGASRGAEFVTGQVGVLPALDADFFQQMSRLSESEAAARLLSFVRSEYGHEAGLSMEHFFSEADYTDRFHTVLKIGPGPKIKRYQSALRDFYIVVGEVFGPPTNRPCKYHRALAERLHVTDTVLTFNYDCVIDSSLRDVAGRRWDPEKGAYGFVPVSGSDEWRVHKGKGRPSKGSIELLKMHGSVNWRIDDGCVALVGPEPAVNESLEGSVIPPTWFKDLTAPPFDSIWRKARIAVRSARIIVVVGYSVPPTDLFSRSLFKVEAGSKLREEKLDLLVVVNPDARARRDFVELVSGGLEPHTRILELPLLSDLAELLGANGK